MSFESNDCVEMDDLRPLTGSETGHSGQPEKDAAQTGSSHSTQRSESPTGLLAYDSITVTFQVLVSFLIPSPALSHLPIAKSGKSLASRYEAVNTFIGQLNLCAAAPARPAASSPFRFTCTPHQSKPLASRQITRVQRKTPSLLNERLTLLTPVYDTLR